MKEEKERLDVLLVKRGLAESREKAKAVIMAGEVFVNNQREDKAGQTFPVTAAIEVRGKKMKYVSRGGYKLEKAMESFPIVLNDCVCMDVGSSTGGFTDCMLQNGARFVYAIDVGTNQLDWKLRTNPHVINLEKTNIKQVTEDMIGEKVDFISTDISFISVLKILPAVHSILKPEGSVVILIKPQFEAGKEKVGKGGVIRDKNIHEDVIRDTLSAFETEGFHVWGITYSPIKGGSGNIEFLALLKKDRPERSMVNTDIIHDIVEESHQVFKGEMS